MGGNEATTSIASVTPEIAGKVLRFIVPREARAQMQCNADACARHYRSFDASDCTYQPYSGGPRRLCTR
jgi:hypothetical protein